MAEAFSNKLARAVGVVTTSSSGSIGVTTNLITGISTTNVTVDVNGNLDVSGIGTIGIASITDAVVSGASTFMGIGTFVSDLYVGGNAYVTGGLTFDEFTARNANITGITTTANLQVGTGGTVTATSFVGDGSGLTGVSTNLTGSVGLSSEGTFVGTGATILDFKSTTGTNVNNVTISSGIATVTIQPGVSLGLAIALGG